MPPSQMKTSLSANIGCAQVQKDLLFTWVQEDTSGYHIAAVDWVYFIDGSLRLWCPDRQSTVRALLIQYVYGRISRGPDSLLSL